MAFAPPVVRGNFYYHDGLYVDVGNLNRHKRASVEEIRTILRPDLRRSKNAPVAASKDQVGHWYEAQLIHYGLPPSKDKARAKMRLLEALNSSRLAVPPNIAQMEAEMKKEYAAAERKAKAELKGSHVPKSEESTPAVGKKRKQAERSVNNSNGNEYHGLSGIADAASSQPQTKKAKKEPSHTTERKTAKTGSLKPSMKTAAVKTEQSISHRGEVPERPRQTARSSTLTAAWLEDPTRGPGPINPATGESYKHPSEMSMAYTIKKESTDEKKAAIKKEPAAKKELAVKKEPAVKKERTVKKETVPKKKPAIKNESNIKKEPVVKNEPAVKKEPTIKKEPAVKKEPVVKKEPAVKKAPAIKKEPNLKKEPTNKKEPTVKKEPAIKKDPGIKKEPAIKKEPVIKRESAIKKEASIKKEPKPKKETTVKDEPSSSPSSSKPPSLGLINGIYDISCPTVESEWDSSLWNSDNLSLTLALEGTTLWGAYDLGMFTGILFLPTRPYRASPTPLPFTWRGRENGEGEMSFGDQCEGEISFLGNGRIEGWISVYGNVRFEGWRREESGTAVRSASSMKGEWEEYNEGAYERERVGRW